MVPKLTDRRLGLALLTVLTATACATGAPPTRPSPAAQRPAPAAPTAERVERAAPAPAAAPARDPHSLSHPDEVVVEHLKLALTVDFSAHRLLGRASLKVRNKTGADRLWLDTRDLEIRKVSLGEDARTQTAFKLGDPVALLGRPLEIYLPPGTTWVHIDYATSPDAAALQWAEPAQTAGGKLPFLYTQSESILARTWIPLQDTPGVRFTYEATIRVPPGMLALMSAENPERKAADGIYRFRMPQAIPSYLMALAVGDLELRPFDGRSGVYAEPALAAKAAYEFADTPKMIAAAEKLYGPYRWGRYDLLLLPPSFPYGGMENPRLTFVTPTLLAGDRSLESLIAHELAHSWSGNLVTNATWNDFWLNEGFTDYFERRIMEALAGKTTSDMLWVLGVDSLKRTMAEMGATNPDTRLHADYTGRDPDDATNDIAYEKGAYFLRALEEAAGRPAFDRFLRTYFDTFAFQSMDSRRFAACLKAQLLDHQSGLAAKIDPAAWIDAPGIPANAPVLHSQAFDQVDAALAQLAQGAPAASLATTGWTTNQWLHFLTGLPKGLTPARMADLDAAFHLSESGNSEILFAWLLPAIENRYTAAYPALDRFLTGMGRRKFLDPLYTALAKTPEGMERALRIYKQARPTYHPVAREAIDKVLDWRG